jgi:predicted Zn-dependent peptidase
LEGATSSLVYSLLSEVATLNAFYTNYLRKLPQDYMGQVIANIQTATVDDLKVVLEKYVGPVFDTSLSDLVVVTGPAAAEEISKTYNEVEPFSRI